MSIVVTWLMHDNIIPGGIVRVCGLAMTPRIILMTDGEPTDSAGSVEVSIDNSCILFFDHIRCSGSLVKPVAMPHFSRLYL